MTSISSTTPALSAYARLRSESVREKLRKAMSLIELEIESHDGIYPYNGGRLSLSELCRRAGVHKVTLQGKTHKSSTRMDAQSWIDRTGKISKAGGRVVRRAVTQRVQDWKARYISIARAYNEVYAIEVIERDSTIAAQNSQITELLTQCRLLEAEVDRLRMELTSKKVVAIGKRMD